MQSTSPNAPVTTETSSPSESDNNEQREQALDRATKLALKTVDELTSQCQESNR